MCHGVVQWSDVVQTEAEFMCCLQNPCTSRHVQSQILTGWCWWLHKQFAEQLAEQALPNARYHQCFEKQTSVAQSNRSFVSWLSCVWLAWVQSTDWSGAGMLGLEPGCETRSDLFAGFISVPLSNSPAQISVTCAVFQVTGWTDVALCSLSGCTGADEAAGLLTFPKTSCRSRAGCFSGVSNTFIYLLLHLSHEKNPAASQQQSMKRPLLVRPWLSARQTEWMRRLSEPCSPQAEEALPRKRTPPREFTWPWCV